MKMDVLDGLKTIKVCLAYKYKGKIFKKFPYDLEVLRKAKPIYKAMPGWERVKGNSKHRQDLHPNAKAYLERLKDIFHADISMVSVGSSREETLFLKK